MTTQPTDSDQGILDAVFAMLGADARYLGENTGTESPAADLEGAPLADDTNNGRPPRPRLPWILHIDDDPDFSRALQLRLETFGVAVRRAFDGMEGFRTAFLQPANVILLDLEMPNGQGDYILRRLKENPVTEEIPVIVITGRRERSIARKMYNLGAAAFLNKPIEFEQLLSELRKHIDLLPEPQPQLV